ncbi:MAG: methyltransferase domain-containing protein [Acidobacteriota bacterium]
MVEYLSDPIDLRDAATVSVYDELPLWSAMFGQLLLRYVPLRPDLRVLDVGPGTGFPMLELAERLGPTCEVHGIDLWRAALMRARLKARVRGVRNVALSEGDAAALPFPDGQFDLTVSNLGINNFTDPERVLHECARVAKPDGLLAMTTNLQGHMRELYEVFEATLLDLGLPEAVAALKQHVDHRTTVTRVSDLLDRTGWRVRAIHEETFSMRFLDGSALLRHYFIRLGFLDGWKAVVPAREQEPVFSRFEARLNGIAETRGELALTIPMAYVEAGRDPDRAAEP